MYNATSLKGRDVYGDDDVSIKWIDKLYVYICDDDDVLYMSYRKK